MEGELDDLTLLDMNKPLQDISPSDTLPEMIKRIVVWAEASDRTEELIQSAMTRVPGNEVLQVYGRQILERIANSRPVIWYRPPADPHDTCFVPGPQAFISRSTLRGFTRAFRAPLGAAVLVVNGISNSGKTFSLQLLAYVRRALQGQAPQYTLARIDLKDEIHSKYEPEMLISDIAGQVGWNTDSLPKRPSTRYVKELCRWVLGQSNQRDTIIVIVLDGFHDPALHAETRDLVQELIRQVSANTSNVRLFLLNLPEALIPVNLPGPVQSENIGPLTVAELTEFFSILYRQKGMRPDPAVIDVIVQSVMAGIPAGTLNYNELLNRKVTAVAMALK